MSTLKPFIIRVADGERLTRDDARAAFDIIMEGEATPAQIGGFLMLLRAQGESVDEIVGAVSAMRARMVPVKAPLDAIDIVGTGGDASGTYNISTATAFVVAGCGVTIAKHGNRALSSKSGAADCLKALGINIDLSPDHIARCIAEVGIGFMFAPAHHAAMRHVGPARVELGTRTIFNLMGPLSNPASVTRQMTGVFAKKWVEPLAEVLRDLGTTRALIAHGSDGLDEITTTGPTYIAELKNGEITLAEIDPVAFGIERAAPKDLLGGEAAENAAALLTVLEGTQSAYADAVLINAAACLLVADKAESWEEGIDQARGAIASGAAYERLQHLIKISNA